MGEYGSIAVYRAVKMKAESPGVYRECPVFARIHACAG